MTDTAFAGKIGIVPSNVGRIRRGEISPTLKLMERIARETNGAVTPNDFLPAGAMSGIDHVSA